MGGGVVDGRVGVGRVGGKMSRKGGVFGRDVIGGREDKML